MALFRSDAVMEAESKNLNVGILPRKFSNQKEEEKGM